MVVQVVPERVRVPLLMKLERPLPRLSWMMERPVPASRPWNTKLPLLTKLAPLAKRISASPVQWLLPLASLFTRVAPLSRMSKWAPVAGSNLTGPALVRVPPPLTVPLSQVRAPTLKAPASARLPPARVRVPAREELLPLRVRVPPFKARLPVEMSRATLSLPLRVSAGVTAAPRSTRAICPAPGTAPCNQLPAVFQSPPESVFQRTTVAGVAPTWNR